jgi:hypothetical protein
VRAMNCRAFHKNFEDYLQDRLDFSNRFAIERHARECISCGKDLADAIELRRMVLDLKQVEAPADFESSLLDKIRLYKAHSRFSAIRRFWIYGPEWLSWKNLMVASSSLAVLVLGIIVVSRRTPPPSPVVVNQLNTVKEKAGPLAAENPVSNLPALPHVAENAVSNSPALPHVAENARKYSIENQLNKIENNISEIGDDIPRHLALPASFPSEGLAQRGRVPDVITFGVTGTEIRPMPMLPRTIWLKYRPASEEYFIQNVSH